MYISERDLLRPARHLFLSPHYDDVPLSCGGTAARISAAGSTPEIALIFGDHPDPNEPLTSFAEGMHKEWGLSTTEVINARRAEESNASKLIGATDMFLPFRDAIYRGDRYTSLDDLFGETTHDESDLPSQIITALDLGNQPREDIRIYAPLAIGGHVDHQHAFRTGVQLYSAGYFVHFYEDLPYALIPGKADDRLDVINPAVSVAGLVDVSSVWETKIDAIMCYPSQLAVIFGEYVGAGSTRAAIEGGMRSYSEKVGEGTLAERFWRISR